MRQGIRTTVDWALIGAELAQAEDNTQVEFFRAFVKECKSWGTNLQVEQQLAAVNFKLTQEERQCLSMLGYHGA